MGRVGTSVKKTFVLTCIQPEEEKQKVTTVSIEWAGF
jgi:tRNA splicing endonuclease